MVEDVHRQLRLGGKGGAMWVVRQGGGGPTLEHALPIDVHRQLQQRACSRGGGGGMAGDREHTQAGTRPAAGGAVLLTQTVHRVRSRALEESNNSKRQRWGGSLLRGTAHRGTRFGTASLVPTPCGT